MKLRFEKDSIIFRLSEEELKRLLTKDTLQESYSFGEGKMAFSIDSIRTAARPSLSLTQQEKTTCLTFYPAAAQVETLLTIGKSREGVCWIDNGMSVALQVDVKQDSRAKMKTPA